MFKKLRRLAGAGALLTAGFFNGGEAGAQSPAPLYTQQTSFRMPIEIADADRAQLAEIRLHVRGPGETEWKSVATGTPDQESFRFEAGGDGEYQFGFVTVGTDGSQYPPNLDAAPPTVVVVVDTSKPGLGVKTHEVANGDTYLEVTLRDENPDLLSLDVEYRDVRDGRWKKIDRFKGAYFHVNHPKVLESPIRVKGKDRAGNVVTSEFRLPGDGSSATVVAPPEMPAPVAVEPPPAAPVVSPEAIPVPPVEPGPITLTSGEGDVAMPGAAVREKPAAPPAFPELSGVDLPKVEPVPVPVEPEPVVDATLLNSTNFALDYALDAARMSVLTRVEFWYTKDHGKTWQSLGEDTDRRSPAKLSMPGDGVYGIVAKVAEGEDRPEPGTEPEFWLEVDTTKPIVSLRTPVVGTGPDAGTVSIVYTALDKNLTTGPIRLYHAEKAEGPWHVIARGLSNEGIYRWELPEGAGPEIFFRVEGEDKAGNVGGFTTPTPLKVK